MSDQKVLYFPNDPHNFIKGPSVTWPAGGIELGYSSVHPYELHRSSFSLSLLPTKL